jgi:hypothetical protein
MVKGKKMAKGKDHVSVVPASELCPADDDNRDSLAVPISPALAKLRYDLLLRRGEAWGVGPWVPSRTN